MLKTFSKRPVRAERGHTSFLCLPISLKRSEHFAELSAELEQKRISDTSINPAHCEH